MSNVNALSAPTQFAALERRKLAYPVIGQGTPLVLAVRFGGRLDSWDPLFSTSWQETSSS